MLFEKVKGNVGPTDNAKESTDKNASKSSEKAGSFNKPASSSQSKPAQSQASGNTLSKDVSVNGKIKLVGDLTIDGKVKGEITTKGVLTLSQNAEINAIITAGTIVIHGKVEGNLEATDRIELLKTAEVVGDIQAAVLKVDAGATFIGNSSIGKSTSVKPEPKPQQKS